jgi:release factor glutamine methyltransferase
MTQGAEPWTVKRLLEWTAGFFNNKGLDAPRLSAELLLSHVLGYPRIRLYTDFERPVMEPELGRFRDLVRRASLHEPIAYLTRTAHFFSLELEVGPGVLIPRPETETLVENVLQFVRHQPGFESPRVLDLCTGSGCIAAAIASNLKAATVVATDISDAAVAIARSNFEKLGLAGRITLLQGDLYDALRDLVDPLPFDLIVANPPYIASAVIPTLDANVREHEPMSALDGGVDGLDPHRRILAGAPDRLTPHGRVFLEIAYDQAELALDAARNAQGLTDPKILKDLGGRDRVLMLRKDVKEPIV